MTFITPNNVLGNSFLIYKSYISKNLMGSNLLLPLGMSFLINCLSVLRGRMDEYACVKWMILSLGCLVGGFPTAVRINCEREELRPQVILCYTLKQEYNDKNSR